MLAAAAGAATALGYYVTQLGDGSGSTARAALAETKGGAAELCIAAQRDDASAVKKLLASGADPNAMHPEGWSPLHAASINRGVNAVKTLLEGGADPNVCDTYSPESWQNMRHSRRAMQARDREFSSLVDPAADTKGFTPLHYACLAASMETVKLLAEHGADPTLKDKYGHVPLEYSDNVDIKSFLESYAATHAEKKQVDAEKALAEEREHRRQFPLEKRVKTVLVGQDGPINAVAAAIRRRENGWHDDEHPLVFLFLGSSGLGKTELAKQIAVYLHGDDSTGFIRMDMTEYQSKHEAAKFIGSPPGYVGYEEGGQLTKLLAGNPKAVVLLDEVEKAHPDVLNLMLQLFDEGRITDGQGTTIECKDAIFVMTSNLASDEIAAHGVQLRQEAARIGTADETVAVSKAFKEQAIRPILKGHFKRDEFLGRIDEMLYFLPFSPAELRQLVAIQLERWAAKAKARHDIELTWSDAVLSELAKDYDVHYGARSLQHAVDQQVVNKLAAGHEQGTVTKGGSVHITLDGKSNIKLECKAGKSSSSWF